MKNSPLELCLSPSGNKVGNKTDYAPDKQVDVVRLERRTNETNMAKTHYINLPKFVRTGYPLVV